MKKLEGIFTKLFGEKPKEGYEFSYVSVWCGWQAIGITWLAKGIGFGEMSMILTENGVELDTECMDYDFCDALVREACQMLDKKETLERHDKTPLINSEFVKTLYKLGKKES